MNQLQGWMLIAIVAGLGVEFADGGMFVIMLAAYAVGLFGTGWRAGEEYDKIKEGRRKAVK